MAKTVVKYYEDAWYKVQYVINEITLDFIAWKIIELDGENSKVGKEPYIRGTIKWDDCVDFVHEEGRHYHYCGIHHVEQYNLLWKEIYKFKWALGGSFLNEQGDYIDNNDGR